MEPQPTACGKMKRGWSSNPRMNCFNGAANRQPPDNDAEAPTAPHPSHDSELFFRAASY